MSFSAAAMFTILAAAKPHIGVPVMCQNYSRVLGKKQGMHPIDHAFKPCLRQLLDVLLGGLASSCQLLREGHIISDLFNWHRWHLRIWSMWTVHHGVSGRSALIPCDKAMVRATSPALNTHGHGFLDAHGKLGLFILTPHAWVTRRSVTWGSARRR